MRNVNISFIQSRQIGSRELWNPAGFPLVIGSRHPLGVLQKRQGPHVPRGRHRTLWFIADDRADRGGEGAERQLVRPSLGGINIHKISQYSRMYKKK
jgi:hypothetical protein